MKTSIQESTSQINKLKQAVVAYTSALKVTETKRVTLLHAIRKSPLSNKIIRIVLIEQGITICAARLMLIAARRSTEKNFKHYSEGKIAYTPLLTATQQHIGLSTARITNRTPSNQYLTKYICKIVALMKILKKLSYTYKGDKDTLVLKLSKTSK